MCGGVALLLGGVTQRPIPLLLLLVAACAERVVDPIGGRGLPSELHVIGTAAGPRGDGGSIALVAPDSLELLLGDTTTTDGRFWRELGFIAGAQHEGALASGVWTCHDETSLAVIRNHPPAQSAAQQTEAQKWAAGRPDGPALPPSDAAHASASAYVHPWRRYPLGVRDLSLGYSDR